MMPPNNHTDNRNSPEYMNTATSPTNNNNSNNRPFVVTTHSSGNYPQCSVTTGNHVNNSVVHPTVHPTVLMGQPDEAVYGKPPVTGNVILFIDIFVHFLALALKLLRQLTHVIC